MDVIVVEGWRAAGGKTTSHEQYPKIKREKMTWVYVANKGSLDAGNESRETDLDCLSS